MAEEVYFQGGGAGAGTSADSPSTHPEQPLSPNEGTQGDKENEPITKEHLARLRAEIEESVLRKAQSLTDKLGTRLDARIKSAQEEAAKAIALAKESGIPLTPEQERLISRNAVDKVYASGDNSPEPQKAEPTASPEDYVTKEVRKIMKQTGVYLDPDEANNLIGIVDSPFDYIQKFKSICESRSTRPPEESRIPTMSAGGGKAPGIDALRAQYDKEIAEITQGKHPTIRRGDVMAVTRMKEEYRKKGLSIY